ncbi:MAG TPA: PQQ-binding-like beta-propeller repeat protein [Thermoplasmata archaeon]|nr:PQQ-binding-like beta-propeller repeat protein [Thermoplasmata archaeon]
MDGTPRSHRRVVARTTLALAVGVALLLAVPAGSRGSIASSASAPPATVLTFSSAGANYNWPEFHQNPHLTGYTANSSLSTMDASGLGVAWATDLYAAALDSPIEAWDPILNERLAYIGTENGNVLAVNVANGAIVWGQWLGSQVRGTPVLSNGSLYVATFSTPAVYKLNATTGAVGCHLVAPLPVEATPLVVTPPGGIPTLYVGAEDTASASGPILAMNAATCALEWKFTGYNQTAGTWDPYSYGVDASGVPLLVFGTADPDSTVYALNAVTGKEVWRFQTYNPGPYDVGAGPVISPPGANGFADGVVYVPNKYGIMYALDLTTGSEIWSTNFNKIAGVTEGGRSTAALDGTNLVFGYNGGMFDLNAVTGAVVWQYRDSSHTEVLSSPAIAGAPGEEVVVAGDIGGHVDVVSLATGSLLYSYATGGYITASPAISNGNILIASSDQFLYDFAVGGGNDAQLPRTAIVSPAMGATLTNPAGELSISGNASDTSGVAQVEVAIQSAGPSGPWWDGTVGSWAPGPYANPATLSSPNAKLTNWTFSYPVPKSGSVYQVTAYAASVSGQSDLKGAGVEYTVLASTKGPHIKASPSFIAPGASVTVTGAGFAASEHVSLSLDGAVLASATTSATGSVPATKVKIPTTTPFGLNAINATGTSSGKSASAAITVANSWEEPGYNAGETDYAPNDPTLDHHVYVGGNTWMYLAWHFDAGEALNASSVVANGVAYAADTSGELFALDTANGGLLWSWTLPSGAALRGSPAVDPTSGRVFVAASDGSLSAIATSTGTLVWSVSVGGVPSAPVFGNGDVFVSSNSGEVAAFVESTGALSWSRVLASSVVAAPSVDLTGNRLVVGETNGDVVALNAATGAVEWSFATAGPVDAAATVSGNVVYVGSGDGHVYALSETTGAQLWSYATGASITASGALLTVGTIGGKPEYAVGSSNGNLYVLQAASGVLNFEVKGTSPIVGLGAVDGVIVYNDAAGVAHATRGYTDLIVWTEATAAGMVTSPIVVDGTVYLTTSDGNLDAFTTFGQPPD